MSSWSSWPRRSSSAGARPGGWPAGGGGWPRYNETETAAAARGAVRRAGARRGVEAGEATAARLTGPALGLQSSRGAGGAGRTGAGSKRNLRGGGPERRTRGREFPHVSEFHLVAAARSRRSPMGGSRGGGAGRGGKRRSPRSRGRGPGPEDRCGKDKEPERAGVHPPRRGQGVDVDPHRARRPSRSFHEKDYIFFFFLWTPESDRNVGRGTSEKTGGVTTLKTAGTGFRSSSNGVGVGVGLLRR